MKTDLYSCRTIYRRSFKENGVAKRTFEERIVLIRAKDFKNALLLAEREAMRYCRQFNNTCTYLGHVNAYVIWDTPLKPGSELYSLIRDSKMSDKAYIRRFFETRTERQQYITLPKKRGRSL